MTLEQAIDHAKEIATEQENLLEIIANDKKYANDPESRANAAKICQKCGADHKQLATWLTELKHYRDTIYDFKMKSEFTIDSFIQFLDALSDGAEEE